MTKIYVSENNEKIEADEIMSDEIVNFQEQFQKQILEDAKIKNELIEAKNAILAKLGISEDEAKILLS